MQKIGRDLPKDFASLGYRSSVNGAAAEWAAQCLARRSVWVSLFRLSRKVGSQFR